jgi:hypothetical protein
MISAKWVTNIIVTYEKFPTTMNTFVYGGFSAPVSVAKYARAPLDKKPSEKAINLN